MFTKIAWHGYIQPSQLNSFAVILKIWSSPHTEVVKKLLEEPYRYKTRTRMRPHGCHIATHVNTGKNHNSNVFNHLYEQLGCMDRNVAIATVYLKLVQIYIFMGRPKLARGTSFGCLNWSGRTGFGGGPIFSLQALLWVMTCCLDAQSCCIRNDHECMDWKNLIMFLVLKATI